VLVFLLHNKLNLGALFDTAGRKASSTFFSVKRYLDLISVKAEKAEIFATPLGIATCSLRNAAINHKC